MMESKLGSQLNIEDEEDESPHVEYNLSVSSDDISLELLEQRMKRDDITIPGYQRGFVWNIKQSSKLIESFLMGLPVPQIFLYVNDKEQHEVIDGQQRLKSVKYFFEGYFDEENSKGNRRIFKLKGLSEHSEYNGKTFQELSEKDQRKLRNSTLRAVNIKQNIPNASNSSVFHIFERLNTGGTQLKPQEIRNAIFRGNIVSELKEMNENKAWRDILGLKDLDKNQKDVEIILRLFSLFNVWNEYKNPMIQHLNKFMSENRDFSSENAILFKDRFVRAVNIVRSALNKPFRPKKVLNNAILDSVMIAVLENDRIAPDMLRRKYPTLLKDRVFETHVTGGTTDTVVVKKRIEIAKRILGNDQN